MRDYIIGSFNIRHFNYESNKDVKKDFNKLANIIKKEKFDVLAIQEALDESAIFTYWSNTRYFALTFFAPERSSI